MKTGANEASTHAIFGITRATGFLLCLLFLVGIVSPVLINWGIDTQPVNNPRSSARHMQTKSIVQPQNIGGASSRMSNTCSRLEAWLQRDRQGHHSELSEDELRCLIWSLPQSDYPLLWNFVQRLLKSERTLDLVQKTILQYWVELDPRAALAAALTIEGRSGGHQNPVTRLLETWARKEPAAALAWIRESMTGSQRTAALTVAIPQLAKSDPQAALAALVEIPPGFLHEHVLMETVRQWAAQDPSAAAGYVSGLPISSSRSQLVQSIAKAWAQKNPAASVEWAQTLPLDRERSRVLNGILQGLEERHPAQAIEMLKKLGNQLPETSVSSVGNIVEKWTKLDVAAASDWVKQLPERGMREGIMHRLLNQWVIQDPRAAAEFAAALPAGTMQRVNLHSVLAKWGDTDSQAVIEWAGGLPDGPGREAALQEVYKNMARSDPIRAADLVANLPPGNLQTQAAVDVATSWASMDAKAAGRWVVNFPEGEARQKAASGVIHGWVWAGQNTVAARWIEELPAGPTRDQAARTLVADLATRQPELVAPWVSAFADEVERNQQIERIASVWLQTDHNACSQWLQTTALSEEKKQQLLAK